MTSETNDAPVPDPAEATDGSVLGEQPGDDSLPGTVGFPAPDPIGVGPTDSLSDADHHDSVAERAVRERAADTRPRRDSIRIVDLTAGGEADTEGQSIGEAVLAAGLVSPEEAAMHIESDDQ